MARRPAKRRGRASWRRVRIHRQYTIDKATRETRTCKGTVRRWLKTGLADSNGPIIPSGPVTVAVYKATVTVASHLFDRDMNHSYANFAASDGAGLLSMAMNPTVTDKYCWIYTEQHDWRGSGWPQNAVPAPFTTAIASARTARSAA